MHCISSSIQTKCRFQMNPSFCIIDLLCMHSSSLWTINNDRNKHIRTRFITWNVLFSIWWLHSIGYNVSFLWSIHSVALWYWDWFQTPQATEGIWNCLVHPLIWIFFEDSFSKRKPLLVENDGNWTGQRILYAPFLVSLSLLRPTTLKQTQSGIILSLALYLQFTGSMHTMYTQKSSFLEFEWYSYCASKCENM